MWLILASQNDPSAMWALQGLRDRGLHPVDLVFTEMLPFSLKWEHRVSAAETSIAITLADGRVLQNSAVLGVLNRVTHVPLDHLSGNDDYDYASQEYAAFFMSWLAAFRPPVLNPASAQGLSGAWRHVSEWVWLAARAGLPTPKYRQTSSDEVDEMTEIRTLFPAGTTTFTSIVVQDRIVGPSLTPKLEKACLKLARLSQTPLLGIDFAMSAVGAPWEFAGATPLPDLRLGGEPLLDALTAALTQSHGKSKA
jgi:hypothetical protein